MSQAGANQAGELTIRLIERQDLEHARRLHNDDGTLLMLHDVRHVSQSEQEAWFEAVSRSETARRYAVLESATGAFVGVFRLDEIDWRNRSASVGLDIVPGFRGRGLSRVIYRYFFNYLYGALNMHRLSLVTLETNETAIRVYRRLGFTEEGRLREAIWRDGRFQDLIQFSMLREECAELGAARES